MTNDSKHTTSNEVEEAIRDYLNKVEHRLKSSGTESAEISSIQDDLETQIRALLMEKGPSPTWNDLTSILSRMDSPDKFIASREAGKNKPSTLKVVSSFVVIILLITGTYTLLRSKDNNVTIQSESDNVLTSPPAAVTVPAPDAAPLAKPVPEIPEPVEPAPDKPVETVDPSSTIISDAPQTSASAATNPEVSIEANSTSVAIASFNSSPNIRDGSTVRLALTDGLINYLSSFHGIRVVERERISEALQELRMSSEGMIDQSTARKLGRMTGARVIITGNILQIDDQLVITARLINSETSELVATRAKGSRTHLLDIIDELAEGVADRMLDDPRGILGQTDDHAEKRASQQKLALIQELKGKELPRVLVLLPETHLNRIIPDPAGETELTEWLLACQFPVAAAEYEGVESPTPSAVWNMESDIRIRRPNSENMLQALISSRSIQSYVKGGFADDADKLLEIADVLILGEGISERASTREGIISCKARLELKVIDIATGNILLAESTYGAGLDVAEHIAGKRALQAAGRQMAIDLIPSLATSWTTRTSSQNEHAEETP